MKLSIDRLKELLTYNPQNGLWIRKIAVGRHGRYKAGSFAGHLNKIGYITIRVDGISYQAHRLAWFYMNEEWPKLQIDHKNLVRSDNKWTNLREATHGQNVQNSSTRKSKSGLKGAHFHKGNKKNPYRARITVNNKEVHLGAFPSKEDAHKAYLKAAKVHFGEFTRAK